MSGTWNQWVPAITGLVFGVAIMSYAAISTRRLDARIRRERERTAAELQPGE